MASKISPKLGGISNVHKEKVDFFAKKSCKMQLSPAFFAE